MTRPFSLVPLFFLLSLCPALAVVPSYVELQDPPTIDVDWSKGITQAVTLHGNRALRFSNAQKGGHYMLIVRQDAIGSRTVTWPSSLRWPGGPPHVSILTTTSDKADFLTIFYDGVHYYALGMSQNY